ncbi:MAG: hypothetical protein IT385_09985 [Deltaproteobacteria bacterium]|nr:hypothetical protein [Deltaproteobacteria bacterium]
MTPRTLSFIPLAALGACLDATPGSQAPGDASGASSSDTRAATTTTTTPDTTTTATPDSASHPDDCDPAGTMCGLGATCCEGLFCTGGPYHYGECTAPQPVGVPCGQDAHCLSGHCLEGVCATPGCAVAGAECEAHEACCSGWCYGPGYGPQSCHARLDFGAACDEDRQCDTGLCVEGKCGGACQADGEACLWDNDCCAGTFCEDGGGRPGTCTPLREVGGACAWDGHCASGTCGEAGTCVAPPPPDGCFAIEHECFSDLECCTGACSWDGESYAQGYCFAPQPAGSACKRDAWCASGRCVEGLCAD